jgi:hypothetical protein
VNIYSPYDNEKSVLVHQIKSVEKPKRIVPSFVWLHPPDESQGCRGNIFSLLFDLFFKYLLGLSKGEFAVLDVPSRNQALARDEIESGPRIVNDIASDGAQSGGSGLLNLEARDDLLDPVSKFLLGNDGVEIISAIKGNDGSAKLCKVLLRSINFGTGSLPWLSVRGDHVEQSE